MKTLTIVLGSVALAVALVVAGLWAGTAWAQGRWDSDVAGYGPMEPGMMGYGWDEEAIDSALDMPCNEGGQGYGAMGMMGGSWSGMPFGSTEDMPCGEDWQGYGMGSYGMMGPGMMGPTIGGNWDWDNMPFGSAQDMPCGDAYATSGEGEIASLEDAEIAVHDYVERLGYADLEVTEIMEFERNYYAIVAEEDTGIGAMEVLVDKSSGAVGPEPGPNMMWNAEYGMMGRGGGMMGMLRPELGQGMGGYATDGMTLSPEEAQNVAQRWLDSNLPGRTSGEADPFYGYYTLHFLNDGQIEGMLSVHGSSGDVWYHSWHGDFVTMIEGHE
jgi:hypothetical protein